MSDLYRFMLNARTVQAFALKAMGRGFVDCQSRQIGVLCSDRVVNDRYNGR